ncbi:MAG: hypothetical protein AB9891_04465 [Anaerolineaceae bacterium]
MNPSVPYVEIRLGDNLEITLKASRAFWRGLALPARSSAPPATPTTAFHWCWTRATFSPATFTPPLWSIRPSRSGGYQLGSYPAEPCAFFRDMVRCDY